MKKLALAISVLAISAVSASAADMAPAPVYTKAPIVPPVVYDWTGFYVGGNIGYSWGRSDSTLSLIDAGAIVNSTTAKFDMDGVIGGGQIGYNWQRDKWVFGLEADIQGSGQKGSIYTTCPGATLVTITSACALGHFGDTTPFDIAAFPVTNSLSENLDWFGTVRGRIGGTFTPTFLAYVTGGLAYGDVKTTDTVSGTNLVGPQGVNGGTLIVPVIGSFSNSSLRAGWTVGAGIEGAIGGNWTAKLEYLYIDLGNVSGTFVTPVVGPSGGFLTSSYSSHITDNILRVGVNYRFSGPVVARY
jgi:outer membrane immunogenic protein